MHEGRVVDNGRIKSFELFVRRIRYGDLNLFPLSLLKFPQEILERLEYLSQKQHQPVGALLLKAVEQFLQTASGELIPPKIAWRVANRALLGDLAGMAFEYWQTTIL